MVLRYWTKPKAIQSHAEAVRISAPLEAQARTGPKEFRHKAFGFRTRATSLSHDIYRTAELTELIPGTYISFASGLQLH